MHSRSLARLWLLPCLLLAAAGCGGPAAPAVQSSVRIISPATGSTVAASGATVMVTVRLSVSHFTLVKAVSGDQPGSGQVWLYENGKLAAELSANSIRLDLIPGSYLFKAALVSNGKVVASAAEIVVSVTSPPVSPVTTSPSTSDVALTKACGAQPPTTTTGTQGLRSGTITLFCKGLPADSLVSWLMMGPGGDLWFTEGPPENGLPGNGIGRITPSGVITVFTRGLSAGNWVGGGLMAGPGGDLWFTGGPGIGRITPSGVITLFTKGLPAGNSVGLSSLNFSSASSLMVGPGGDLWFTVWPSSISGQPGIGRITPSGVITLFTKGLPSGSLPYGLRVGPGGDLWFTMGPPHGVGGIDTPSIGRITPSGVITLFTKGLPPANAVISSLIADRGGNLWFTVSPTGSSGQPGIGRITPSGVITVFTKGLPANSQVPYLGVVTGPDGNLWFTDQTFTASSTGVQVFGPASIGRITPSGAITLFTKGLPADSQLSGLMTGPGGDLWFTVGPAASSGGITGIGRITPSGVITLFTNGLPAGSEPYGLMAGPGGDLWFTAGPPFEGGTGIGRITPSGRITMVTMGLSADSWVNNLVAGPGGDLWANVEWPTNTSPTLGIGRITP